MELSDLTQKRQKHVESIRNNNDKSHEIISGLYSDPSHFIYEILQNADDADASEVIFKLTRKALSITHNGKKLFTFEDVESITTVGSSTKEDDVNSIGKFGAGFKSVFAITKTPHIYSGDFNFQITDYIVPKEVKPANIEPETTQITLPFNHPKMPSDAAYEEISDHLQALESESLLFLHNIKEIQWNTETDNGRYFSKIDDDKVSLISQVNNEEDNLKKYFLCTKNITIANAKLKLVVAYLLNNDGVIIPNHDSKLFVFFPTKVTTGFKFLVHAPYKTTPSRETIPFHDPQNQEITRELSALVAESIQKLKDSELLNVGALSILPILPIQSDNPYRLYNSAFHQVKSIFEKESLLPTSIGDYEKAGNTLLASGKELTNLLESTDCLRLFKRSTWLSTDITQDKTRELMEYLTSELGIPEITMDKFCSEINDKFIKMKSDKWLINFYSSITNSGALYAHEGSIFRERPIIRLEDGSHINPYDDSGDIQVYLPTTGESKFKTVKRVLTEQEESYEFLKNLGLKEPDNIAEIKEFIVRKYQSEAINIDEDEYIEDVKSVLAIWSNSNEYQKTEISDLLNECYFVRCKNQIGDVSFQKPKETSVYFSSKSLSEWFDGGTDETLYFIDAGIEITKEIRDFFKSIDVNENLKIIKEDDELLKYKLLIHNNPIRYCQRVDDFNPYIRIDGLEQSLENINKDRSTFLWQFLLANNPGKLCGRTKERKNLSDEFVTGVLQNSAVLKLLKTHHWLYDKKSTLIKQPLSAILLNDLSDDYNKENDNVEKLVEVLDLKLDKVAEFEAENTDKKVIDKKEYEELEEIKKKYETLVEASRKSQDAQDTNGSDEEDSWTPEVDPEDAVPIEDDADWIKRKTEDLSGQGATEDSTDNGQENNNREKNSNNHESVSPKNSKKIGDWGETVASNYLKEKYPEPENEVVWLNRNGGIGKGYDFVIRNNGEDIYYYEIKSKTDESPKLFQVSGTQWNWAKRLHSSKKGDMYKILVISGAGTTQPKIREINNPVGLWKSGKLYADPVNIEL